MGCATEPNDIICALFGVNMVLALPADTCRVTQETGLGRQEVRFSVHLCLTDSLPRGQAHFASVKLKQELIQTLKNIAGQLQINLHHLQQCVA